MVLHHLELRTRDLDSAAGPWTWLLGRLGYTPFQAWPAGRSWSNGTFYIVLEAAPNGGHHDRRIPGLSHIAFRAGTRSDVDRFWTDGTRHGWSGLYQDRHPFAGGRTHYAAYLENEERFKVELVADAGL
jgi:catechol 2,3-dioxygenase-like lactoylglutathione lyase family enzyme